MKKVVLSVVSFVFSCCFLYAQSKLPPVDKSPMDMSYYPAGYPVLKIQDKLAEPLMARVIFSRPQKNGRSVFGELLEYGKMWRLGANETTEIEFFQPARINGTRIKRGRYTMYAIPYPEKWTLIINKDTDSWGAFKYDETKDVVRIDVPVQKQTEVLESFVMAFEKTQTSANLIIGWDDIKVSMPITFL